MSLSFVFRSSISRFEAVLVVADLCEVVPDVRSCMLTVLGDSIGRFVWEG